MRERNSGRFQIKNPELGLGKKISVEPKKIGCDYKKKEKIVKPLDNHDIGYDND